MVNTHYVMETINIPYKHKLFDLSRRQTVKLVNL